ncbi:MAG: MFS transporter [Deltaproteobacteria bacterium]|nr:MFS transporter [Deltaproteobacteria bacterium]
MPDEDKLFTREFLAIDGVIFIAFSSLAIFYGFERFLATLPIAPKWFGLIIGLFALATVIIRPVISPFFHPGNAKKWMTYGIVAVIISLLLYQFADNWWTMSLIRVFHGAGHSVLCSAGTTLIVGFIPEKRSGQAFGIITALNLVPYGIIPPLAGMVTGSTGGFLRLMDYSAIFALLAFPLVALIRGEAAGGEDRRSDRMKWPEIADALKGRNVILLQLICLLVWTAYAPVFFLIDGYAKKIGVMDTGWFFTASVFTEVIVRLVAGKFFDRISKVITLAGSAAWLTLGYLALANCSTAAGLYSLGAFLGLGWGAAMPVITGLMFDISSSRHRPLLTNFLFVMYQGGFVLGPVIGAYFLNNQGYRALYYVCGGLVAIALVLTPFIRTHPKASEAGQSDA